MGAFLLTTFKMNSQILSIDCESRPFTKLRLIL